MLENFKTNTDDAKRQLYVAMTRTKHNLTIHYNGNYLGNINAEGLYRLNNIGKHSLPEHLLYHLTHKNIYLEYFKFIQRRLDDLKSGDALGINKYGLINSSHEQIVKFSNSFQKVKNP